MKKINIMREIKILVVDDEVAEDIKENLENFIFLDARLSIEAVDTCQDAITRIEKLKKDNQFYDVVIVDMKMDDSEEKKFTIDAPEEGRSKKEDTEEKGLEILRIPLPSIKIVLTALSSVENCIKCLKAGAYDYIDKNSIKYDPYERLKNALKESLEERLKEPEDLFMKWKEENLARLQKKYGGKYIAVIAEEVVDADKNKEVLNKRLKENYPFFKAEIMEIPNKTVSLAG